jgi:Ring finger domain
MEDIPLVHRLESHREVRRNLYRTFEYKIYTSYTLLVLTVAITLTRLIGTFYILNYLQASTEVPLYLWNLVGMALDCIYLGLKALRLPYIKRARESQEIEEHFILQIAFLIQAACYIVWQFPGNVWFWSCSDCLDEAPAISIVTLVNLILGYLYLLAPALLLISICACLPVAIVFVMLISGISQHPASENMLTQLLPIEFDPQEHVGESNCTICAVEYVPKDKIIIMQCDPRHFFHEECIKKWLRINSNCPICRAPYVLDS